jgi:hypothetical protein
MFWTVVGALVLLVAFFATFFHGMYRQFRLRQELCIDPMRISTWTAEYWLRSLLLGIPYLLIFLVIVMCALLLLF